MKANKSVVPAQAGTHAVLKINDATDYRPLLNLLESMSDKAGAQFLIELITHPNQPIHVTQLRHLHNLPLLDRPEYRPIENHQPYKSSSSTRSGTKSLNNPFAEESIRYCDQKTLDQLKKRLIKLQCRKSDAQHWNDYAKLDEIYKEEEFLLDYLKKAINRKGQPRYLRDKVKDDYSYLKKTIDRIIDKIRVLDPSQARIIESHLKTGLRFSWENVVPA